MNKPFTVGTLLFECGKAIQKSGSKDYWEPFAEALNQIAEAHYKQQTRWIPVEERLPEIDASDKWNSDYKITKDVLCLSKEWGIRFGRYFYLSGFWTVNGVTSSNGVTVEYWMPLPDAP